MQPIDGHIPVVIQHIHAAGHQAKSDHPTYGGQELLPLSELASKKQGTQDKQIFYPLLWAQQVDIVRWLQQQFRRNNHVPLFSCQTRGVTVWLTRLSEARF